MVYRGIAPDTFTDAADVVVEGRMGEDGTFHATDGLCTHEQVHLCNGLVDGDTIECPKHNGRFNYRTGAALRAPVCIDLRRYAVRLVAGRVEIDIG